MVKCSLCLQSVYICSLSLFHYSLLNIGLTFKLSSVSTSDLFEFRIKRNAFYNMIIPDYQNSPQTVHYNTKVFIY